MHADKRTDFIARDTILALLSETELARLSALESGPPLLDGDDFLDLEHLDRGVHQAPTGDTPIAHVLPRKAVHGDTWTKILTALGQA